MHISIDSEANIVVDGEPVPLDALVTAYCDDHNPKGSVTDDGTVAVEILLRKLKEIVWLHDQGHPMTRAEKLELLREWRHHGLAIRGMLNQLNEFLSMPPEAELQTRFLELFQAYTGLMAEKVGDKEEWLEWYAWECDFGEKPKEVIFSDGEKFLVAWIKDLIEVIDTNDDGTRKRA